MLQTTVSRQELQETTTSRATCVTFDRTSAQRVQLEVYVKMVVGRVQENSLHPSGVVEIYVKHSLIRIARTRWR